MNTKIQKAIWKAHRLLAPGCLAIIKPTIRCNYNCEYCSNVIATGERLHYDEVRADDWINYLNRFPVSIQVVAVSGGEPMLYPYINELLEKLIENGYWVRMLTNLSLVNEKLRIKPTPKFCLQPSFHATQTTKEEFTKRLHWAEFCYNVIKVKRFTDVDIKGSSKFSIIDEKYEDIKRSTAKNHWFRNKHTKFVVTPDLQLFPSCFESNVGRVLSDDTNKK